MGQSYQLWISHPSVVIGP